MRESELETIVNPYQSPRGIEEPKAKTGFIEGFREGLKHAFIPGYFIYSELINDLELSRQENIPFNQMDHRVLEGIALEAGKLYIFSVIGYSLSQFF